MTMQYTPGPWGVWNGTDIFPIDDTDGDRQVADCAVRMSGIPSDEQSANARLIAAAPALLEALEPIGNIANSYDGIPAPKYFGDTDGELRHPDSLPITITLGQCRAARAAIASAKGAGE